MLKCKLCSHEPILKVPYVKCSHPGCCLFDTLFKPEEWNFLMGAELCICAAVKTECGEVIRGHRHADCFTAIMSRNKKILKEQGAQGFITSTGRYVDRAEGAKLLRGAGIKSRAGFVFEMDDILTSEDLY